MKGKIKGIIFLSTLFFLTLIISCAGNKDNNDEANNPVEKKVKEVIRIPHDTLLTNIAKYIAGIECSDTNLIKLQDKIFYKTHRNFTDTAWLNIKDSTLTPLKAWLKNNNFVDEGDTTTLYYPFAGPDFLYAHTFYPKCENIIMFGLERLGTVPDFTGMTENEIAQYLEDIRNSLRYLNYAGYFVTSHMGSDFSKRNLNGNIHMILYFLARTNHKIIKVTPVTLDSIGNPMNKTDYNFGNNIRAIKIEYCDSEAITSKTVYYFSLDVSDENLASKPQFAMFVNKYSNRVAFFKAASYILFNPNFKIVKNLALDCKKIIQDDSGLPYRDLNNDNYDLQMFGTYTRTITQIPWGYQSDLQEALEATENNYDLPFKISYNMHYGEGILMCARKK